MAMATSHMMPPIFVAIAFDGAAATIAVVVVTIATSKIYFLPSFFHSPFTNVYMKIVNTSIHSMYRNDTIRLPKTISPAYQSFLKSVSRFICYRAHRQMKIYSIAHFFLIHTFLHVQILCVIRI